MNDITIIIITYKSENVIHNFIKDIPSTIKTIIVENSQNHELKKEIEKNYSNISVYIKKNNGVSSALNFAAEKIKTKYFLQISPDIRFNFEDLKIFFDYKKSHKQIDAKLESGEINSIHGSCMFINKKNFDIIGKFDENFFLYFEETEYCFRAQKKGFKVYQINKIEVETKGRSVETNKENNQKFDNILIWHFIWSKYYFSTKKRGKLISLVLFTPLLLRINLRIFLYKILKNDIYLSKYQYRLNGLIASILGKNSDLRP